MQFSSALLLAVAAAAVGVNASVFQRDVCDLFPGCTTTVTTTAVQTSTITPPIPTSTITNTATVTTTSTTTATTCSA